MSQGNSVPYAYAPLLPNPNQTVIILPVYYEHRVHRYLRPCLSFTAVLLFLLAAMFFLYPSDPDLQLARLRLNNVRVNSSPKLTLDLSFSLTIKVRNRDFFSLYYDRLVASVGYRGRELGLVSAEGERVRARGTSYVGTTLDLDGLEVMQDSICLIADWERGVIPFDTSTQAKGVLGLLFFKIPLKAKVSCEVYVNTNKQTIIRQDCYPV